MKLASFDVDGERTFGAVRDDGIIDLGRRLASRFASLLDVIQAGALGEIAPLVTDADPDFQLGAIDLLPPVMGGEKILCIGVNYANRNEEYKDGSELPKYPSMFFRVADSFVGHGEPLVRPKQSDQLDYEGEIVLVVGKGGRHIAREDALDHVCGLTLANEGTIRDWVRHAKFNVTQGKNFDSTGAIGPWMVTTDELDPRQPMHLTTTVNGQLRQDDTTENLIFPFADLLVYVSSFMTLKPGDMILTGTPTGAGARFDPPIWLKPGDVVEITVPEIGVLKNGVVDET
ncbi:fumarylacetoacetate hydrolase family protein [Breoghania sp. L-A4]|uniref:fumarylacetoacetate hydrolase family protein n=1 Tax=Breoghania sp. L-A4 TaxID=2304600 RepID=UPI000E358FBE|nr:fumarylacetoacetate hydrolase family protein [Breoghania sp. L-A4]AXS42107.1 FAA hydrolase family protein [Breoghania sp. L-A4]